MAKEKQHSFFGPDKPKYSVEEIQKIVEYNKVNEKLLNKLVEAKYDSEEIDWVFNLLNTNEKLVNDLLKSDRFKDFNKMTINNLVQIANKDSELVNTILNETAEKFDGSQKQRFDKYDIQSLISALTTNDFENFDYIKNLINLKDKSGKFRLDSNSIIKLGEKYSQDKNLVMELLDAKNLNGDYRFSGTDITTLIPILKGRNSEFAKKLLNEKVGNEYRFEPFNIQSILDANKINEQFTKYLLDAKKSDNTPRFTGDDIKNIVNANEINPDKVKELLEIKTVDSDGKPTFAFNGSSILNFVKDETNYDLRNKLLSIKSPDNSYNLLSGYDIDNIISMYEKNADAVTELVNNKKYNMFLKNINARNIELFANKNLVNEISNEIPENTVDYSFSRPYLENQWQVTFKTDDGSKTLFINKNNDSYTISARETTHKQGDNTRVRKEFADGTVLVEEIQYTNISADNTTIPFPNSLKKTLYDNQGVQTRSEVIAPSQDKPGAYTINVYERGLNQRMKKKPAGTVQMYGSKNQGSKTVRTVTSEDGSITSHTIIQGPKGSGMTYQIKDKDGNILANIERRHRKIDDNHYTSSFNGQKYDMQFSNDKITVSKTDNDGNVIETIELDSNQLDFNLIDLYKQLPGDYLFKIKDMNTKITFDNSNKITDKNNACFSFVDNTIYISSELKNNPFVFAHELGHAIDFNSGIISKNPDLAKVYQEELEAYKSATSDAEGQSIDYFTNQENGTAIPESIAETHALMSGMINEDFNTIMLRSVVLQQHFPKTIAKISELIQTTPIQKNNQGNNGSLQHIPEQYVMRPNRPHLPEPGSLKKIPTDLKDISKITPEITQEELNIESGTIIEYINPNAAKDKLDKPENKRLTEQGEELVWRAAEGLRQNALSVENDIVKFMYEAGLAKDETLSHRSKGLQSLHDKLRTYLIENPDKTLEDAIRSVKDSIGVRTVNKSVSFANHPEVKELLEKGDIKSAQLKAVELESDYVLQGLMGIIDKMADGTADIKLTRVANYMGEDGIPYFTENQLNKLRNHAYSKGIDIPIVERTTNAAERVSADDIYNENASTKIRKSGYTALQMNFVTKDGDIFEWQYRGDKLNDFGEGEHVPYDLRTGKDIIGNDKVLTPLYEPMKELLQNKDIMPDNLYKEYNAYLTAHYKYLRLTELGFEAEKPKLPKGIDERLRADNLILLHDIADKLKKGKITQEEALKEYNDKLIRNTDDNVTDISYKDALTNIVNDADIDRYEARVRLSKRGDNKTVDYSILTKSCMDKSGKIKNNLVRLAEDLRSKGINDDIIASFLNKFKNDNGQIPSDIMNNFNQFINNYKQGVLDNRVISAFLAIPYKSGTKNLDMSFMPKIIELSKEKTIPLKALQTMSDVYSKIDINKSPDGYDYLTAVTKNIFSRNDKILNDLRDADLKNILSSLIAKDGSIDKNAGDIVSALFDVNLGKNKIAQLISSSKNTLTGKIDDSFKNDLLQFISMGKNIKPAYTQYTIQQLIAASTITKNTIINGKNTVYNIHDLTEFKKYFNEYVNQQKQMGITKYPIEHLRNASLIFKVIKNPDGTINTAKQQLAKSMIANKFTTSAIQEVIIRASNPNGTLNPRIVQAFVKNYNNLPKEEKANLISVDIKLEQGILRQTMRFKDGSSKIFDINPVNVDVKIPYDIQTRKSNNNNLYIKLKDSQRGKTTKTTSKNGKTISEITIINDVNGNKIGTEYVSRSSAGDGILDVRFRDNEGNTHILSSAERDLNGNLVVKKDFYSNNGTRTQYDYTENPNGSYNSTYIITDSSGKVLLNENRTFTVIDETHFKSSINEQEYDIQIDDLNVMTVTNSAGEKVRFDLDSKTLNNYNDFKYLLTRIPGHEFFNMAKTGLASISFMSENNAHYIPGENVIELGNGHNTLSTFFHEFGHNKDWLINSNNYRNVIRDDKQFLQIYENERIAFMKDFPNLQRDFISYFISLDNPQSRGNQSQREVIAESNNILSTPKQGEGMEFRKYYLQRYFPETIAYLAKKLNPDVYNK